MKTVVITGGSRGIGAAAVELFAAKGDLVFFLYEKNHEAAAVVAENPAYGRIVCRCETVTEGEIVAALHESIPPTSINGVKRRCGAGMGRCQGGFCSPVVHELISRELGLAMEDIPMEEPGSWILTREGE